jgi:hypothetical protein
LEFLPAVHHRTATNITRGLWREGVGGLCLFGMVDAIPEVHVDCVLLRCDRIWFIVGWYIVV